MDKLIIPKAQRLINSMFVINQEALDAEARAIQEEYEAQASGAYEAGQADAAKDIRNLI